jgi:hypothetical protein
MFEFITASANLPFSVSLTIMIILSLLEGAGLVMGVGLSSFLDSLLPDIDVDVDVDLDLDADVEVPNTVSGFSNTLGWLHIGKVPFLIILIVFLTSFGLCGLSIQSISIKLFGGLIPGSIAWLPALFTSLPITRTISGILGKILPNDETEAVSEESFIGKIATITIGTAQKGSPARAKFKDEFNQWHNIMVEPDTDGEEFSSGASVIIINRTGNVFIAAENPYAALLDN